MVKLLQILSLSLTIFLCIHLASAFSTRRSHTNKYKDYSKTESLDPIQQTIERVEIEKASREEDKRIPSRGTTVPTKTGSPKLDTDQNELKFGADLIDVKTIIPSDPFTFGYVQIGVVSGPHGVKGELKVHLSTDFSESRMQQGQLLYVKRPNRLTPRPIRVANSRKQVGNSYLVTFDSITTRLSAAALKGYIVYVKKSDRPSLEENEYLVRDLVGMECYRRCTDTGQLLGPIAIVEGVVPPDDLCSPEAAKLMHALLELRKCNSNELFLIPLVPSLVLSVEMETRRVVIDPPQGLMELTYVEKKREPPIRGLLPVRALHLSIERRRELERNVVFVS